MTLSDTQASILCDAAQHQDGLAVPKPKLPPGPRASIARALLNARLVARADHSDTSASWKLDGEVIWLCITDTGREAIGKVKDYPTSAPGMESDTAGDAGIVANDTTSGKEPPVTPSSPQHRPKLRDAAASLLALWDATAEREPLADAVAALRAALGATPGQAPPTRTPRQGTKQEAVLALPAPPRGRYHRERGRGHGLGSAYRPRLLRRPEKEGAHGRRARPRSPERTRQRRCQGQLQHLPRDRGRLMGARPHPTRYAVALYRVSTAEQGHSGLGMEAQQAFVRAFVAAQGWTLIEEFSDIASGKDDGRPGFQAALARCRQLGATLVAARLDRITRRAHTLSQLLEDGYSVRAADMPGADDLMMRIYAAMAQKERELISERTRAALAAAKARGAVLGGDRGYRPPAAPCAAVAAAARADEADRTAHRVRVEIERLRRDGVESFAGIARELTVLGVPTPRQGRAWTHTTVTRVIGRAKAAAGSA